MSTSAGESDQPPSLDSIDSVDSVVSIVDDTAKVPEAALDWLHDCLGRLAEHLAPRPRRIAVRIVDDAEMSAAHEKFSNVPGTTDVLTFVGERDPIDVDVLICRDEAERRAVDFKHGVEHELLLYALHGVLHAAGHDDHDAMSYEAMHAEEDRLLTLVGIGSLFDPDRRRETDS